MAFQITEIRVQMDEKAYFPCGCEQWYILKANQINVGFDSSVYEEYHDPNCFNQWVKEVREASGKQD